MLNDSCSTAYFKKITDKKSTQRLGEKSVYESCLPIFRKFFDSRRIVPQSPLRWKERSSRIIAGAITFFSPKGPGDYSRDGNFSREAIISNIAHWKSFSKYFVLFSDWIKKITSTKLNMDFLSVPNLVPWLKSISSLSELQSSLISFAEFRLHFTETVAKGMGGGGDYSREAMILNISVKGKR